MYMLLKKSLINIYNTQKLQNAVIYISNCMYIVDYSLYNRNIFYMAIIHINIINDYNKRVKPRGKTDASHYF